MDPLRHHWDSSLKIIMYGVWSTIVRSKHDNTYIYIHNIPIIPPIIHPHF